MKQYFMEPLPNNSMANKREVIGQLVTPQNTLTVPHAAHRPTGSEKTEDRKLPKVAPTNNVGTISPPLYPPPSVTPVNSIFRRNTYQAHCFMKLAAIILAPAPK